MRADRLLLLLVEDDHGDALSSVGCRGAGVDVIPATGSAALTILRMEPVDVVVVEEGLRGMSGLTLLDRVAALLPRVGRVLTSPHLAPALVDGALRRGRIHAFLRQPFCADDLVAAAAAAVSPRGALAAEQAANGHPLTVH